MDISLNSNLFWSLFKPGIPLIVYVSCIVVGCIGSAVLMLSKRILNRHILLIWLSVVLFLMLYATVIGRIIDGIWVMSHESGVHLMPFWSIQAIKDGYIETLYEKIYNVLFFVPYGVLLKAYPQPLHKEKASPKSSPESLTPSPSPEGKGDRKASPRPRKIGEWISGIREFGKKKKSLPNPLLKERESIREGKGGQLTVAVLIGCLTSVIIELLQFITRTGTCETDDVICNTIGCAVGAGMAVGVQKIYRIIANGKKND